MSSYRAYFINYLGHITGAKDLAVSSFEEALHEAKLLATERTVELWKGDAMLTRFEPSGSGSLAMSGSR